jgi:gp16 family phage-associated protein
MTTATPSSIPLARSPEANLRSPEEAQRWFLDRGVTISEWAMKHNFNPGLVYQVLAGQRKALRGRSFEIAVALKLKARPIDDEVENQTTI